MIFATGCAMDKTVDGPSSQGDFISVGPTTTKAPASTVSSMQTDGFRVFATGGDVATTNAWYPGIDGNNLHIYDGGYWNFEQRVAWPNPTTEAAKYPMTFYAWYPAYPTEMPEVTASPAATPILRGKYTVKPTAAEHEDFIAGKAVANTKPAGGNLPMTFHHVLSRIDVGIVSGKGATPIIQGMGIAYIGDSRVFDFTFGTWMAQPETYAAHFPYYGTLDFHREEGSPTVLPVWYAGPGEGDDEVYKPHEGQTGSLMLMPQTGRSWVPVAGSAPTSDAGLIYILYRMYNNQPAGYPYDEVGYASARIHPDYPGSGYEGPLYALVGFPLSPNPTFTWEQGKGYIYHIGLGNIVNGIPSCNGYLLSEYYYDSQGRKTTYRVRDGRRVGEKLNDGVIHVSVNVNEWNDVTDEV